MKKYTFIDLFAGCGGLSEGFLQTGKFEGIAHIEWESPMINTLRQRLIDKWGHTEDDAMKRVIKFDVQKTDELLHGDWSESTKELYEKENHPLIVKEGLDGLVGDTEVDMIIGGPPCQAYSIAGRAQSPHGERVFFKSGKSHPKWYADGLSKTKTKEERQKWRSKTFPGIARAIAEQWTIQIAVDENILSEEEKEILGDNYKNLLDKMTGGIRYTSAMVNQELEKVKYPVHFDSELVDEIERREQKLIKYWYNQ